MTFVSSVEDALYAPGSIVTVAITNQFHNSTDVLVLVKNNWNQNVGEDLDCAVTFDEVEPCF